MGTYFDCEVTITGSRKSVKAAKASLSAHWDQYDTSMATNDEPRDCSFRKLQTLEKGKVSLAASTFGEWFNLTAWTPEFWSGEPGEVMLDVISDMGCERHRFQEGEWKLLDFFPAEVFDFAFDLWCRSETDTDGDNVRDRILRNLQQYELQFAFKSTEIRDRDHSFWTTTILVLALGRLVEAGHASVVDLGRSELRVVLETILTFSDAVLRTGVLSYDEDLTRLLSLAKAWAEAVVLDGKTANSMAENNPATDPKRSKSI